MRTTIGTLLASAACAFATAAETNDELLRQAAAMRPTAHELRWMAIPWQNSAVEAERLARETRRPILYWNVDDDPLDRC